LNAPRIVAFGDAAILIDLGDPPDGSGNRAAHRMAAAIDELRIAEPGYGRPVPGLGNVLVRVDPQTLDLETATERLAAVTGALHSEPEAGEPGADMDAQHIELPTRYGGDHGADLAEVARLTGLGEAEVVELHASVEYRVLFLGFAPGFAYLGDLPPALAVARLATPRPRVPAGSVAIAGRQTAVYPFSLPGGWRLIGGTESRVWDLERPTPALLMPGARVRFVPIR
jgi:KipI family sensor histidine kinase inhibitor